jgi:hypothetical protein
MSTLVPIAFMRIDVKFHPEDEESVMTVHISKYITGSGVYVLRTANEYYREDDSLLNILNVFFSELRTTFDYVKIKEINQF